MALRKNVFIFLVFVISCVLSVAPVKAKELSDMTQSEVQQVASEYSGVSGAGVITHFLSNVLLNDKGDATITEFILVFFPQPRHGIFRWIPNYVVLDSGKKLKQPITIKSVSYYKLRDASTALNTTRYTSYSKTTEGAGYTVLKIGDPDTYISGAYLYEIQYVMKNAVRMQDGYQELYLNVTGDQWELPILNAKALVSPAKSVLDTACYTGRTGSTESQCSKAQNGTVYSFTSGVDPGMEVYGMTIALKYKDNTFAGPSAFDLFIDQIITFFPLLILAGAILFAYSSWDRFGRDKKVSAVPPVFIPTKEMKEGNLSIFRSLLHMRPTKTDVLAELIKIAEQGLITLRYESKNVYIEVEEKQKVKLIEYLATQPTYIMTLVSTLTDNFAPVTNIKNLKSVYADMERMHREADSLFTSSAFVDPVSSKKRTLFITLTVLSFLGAFGSIFLFSESDSIRLITWAGAAFGSAIAFLIASVGMLKRTRQGDSLFIDLLGLKKYISAAEVKRLEFFNNPKKMIEHFEELLPFAVILGLDRQWTKEFGPILEQMNYEPTWIRSDIPLYNALPRTYAAMASSMNSYVTKISTPPQSSGSSFSGGGGFSGGGSGGGGGGSW